MNEKDYIQYLFNLPPEEIIAWYKSKGYTFSWKWQDVWQSAHTRAFTVAKVMKLDILQSIKDEVDRIFTEGITFNEFQRDLEPTLKRLGWWGKVKAKDVPGYKPSPDVDPEQVVQLGSPRRLKTIYQVNANIAYAAGRYNTDMQAVQLLPYWRYNQIDRKTKRKSHEPFAGKIFRWDDPIWNIIYPPSDWLCGCTVTPMSEYEIKSQGLKISKGKDFMALAKRNIPAEWQYNPAKDYLTWKPDLSIYDNNIKKLYNE